MINRRMIKFMKNRHDLIGLYYWILLLFNI